jgi:hypothetical protein
MDIQCVDVLPCYRKVLLCYFECVTSNSLTIVCIGMLFWFAYQSLVLGYRLLTKPFPLLNQSLY